MSETTEAEPAEETPVAAPEPAVETPTEGAPAAEAAPETPAEPDPKPKPTQSERRYTALVRKASDDRRRAELAESRAEAAEALLAAQREASGEAAPKPVVTEDAVRAEAIRLREQERTDERRRAVIKSGVDEFGEASWNEKTGVLATLGATENPAFMAALVELDNAPKLVAALSDDADELDALLKMPPVAMAAKMGRMAAKLDTPAPDAKPKVSTAPRPVTPVSGRAVAAPDIYDDKLSMREYVALRRKTAPAHLGGQGKPS